MSGYYPVLKGNDIEETGVEGKETRDSRGKRASLAAAPENSSVRIEFHFRFFMGVKELKPPHRSVWVKIKKEGVSMQSTQIPGAKSFFCCRACLNSHAETSTCGHTAGISVP